MVKKRIVFHLLMIAALIMFIVALLMGLAEEGERRNKRYEEMLQNSFIAHSNQSAMAAAQSVLSHTVQTISAGITREDVQEALSETTNMMGFTLNLFGEIRQELHDDGLDGLAIILRETADDISPIEDVYNGVPADFNSDGVKDIYDYNIWQQYLGK